MFKRIILIVIISFPGMLYAQDRIVLNSGETMDCKIQREDSVNLYLIVLSNGRKVESFIPKEKVKTYSYAPEKKRVKIDDPWLFELNFKPFQEDELISFEYFQAKYLITERIALRLGLQLDYKSNKISSDDYEVAGYKPTQDESSFLFGVKPGLEFRLLSASRISPYIGFEMSYSNKTSKAEYVQYIADFNIISELNEVNRVEIEVDGAWMRSEIYESGSITSGSYTYYRVTNYGYERGYTSMAGNLLFGADVYLIKNVYLGVEAGLGYQMRKLKPVNVKQSNSITDLNYPSGRESEFSFFYNNAIRLGVRF